MAAFFIKIRTADAAKAVIEEARNEHRLFRKGNGFRHVPDLRELVIFVYLTNKTDSHLKRGRFGRGF